MLIRAIHVLVGMPVVIAISYITAGAECTEFSDSLRFVSAKVLSRC